MKKDLILDFDPIKDGTWNMTPFHSDYVPPQRKSSPINPYELMPVYPAFDADPAAPLPKPKTRAVTGLDDFGEGKREMMDLVHQTSNFGLTQSIAEEFNLADPPHRKRIRDNVANAQDWWQAANDDQIKDQAYAANFSKAARWAREYDDDISNFGTVMSTASKFEVQPMELNNYLNGAPEERDGFVAGMNDRIMPWAPGSPLVQLPDPQYATNQHPTTMTDATEEPLELAQVNQPQISQAPLAQTPPTPKQKPPAPLPRKVLYDPDTEKTLKAIRYRESRYDYREASSPHYSGAYQMSTGALKDAGMLDSNGKWTGKYGMTSRKDFLNSKIAQDRAVMDYFRALKRQLKNWGANQFIGTTIDGIRGKIRITNDALIAASHRRGAKAVYLYLVEQQKLGWKSDPNMSDAHFHIETRLREFANSTIKLP